MQIPKMHRGRRDSKKLMFLQQSKTHPSKAKNLPLHEVWGESMYLIALLSIAVMLSIVSAAQTAPAGRGSRVPGAQGQPLAPLPRRASECPECGCAAEEPTQRGSSPVPPQCSRVFWFGLDKYKVPTKAALSLPLLNWTGERKYGERLKGRDKGKERSLTSYCHRQNRLNLGRKGSLIHHQSNQSRIMRE